MIALSKILLSNLEFGHQSRFFHSTKQRTKRFARLKINRTVLYLNNHIIPKLPIELMKFIVSQFHPVVARLVHKCTPHHNSTKGFQCIGKHIGTIYVCTPIIHRTWQAFGISFHQKTSEIGYQFINLCCFRFPPFPNIRIQWIRS